MKSTFAWQLAAGCGLLLVFGLLALPARSLAQGGPPLPSVVVATVEEKPLAGTQSFVGTLSPMRRSVVGSAVDGRVVEYFANDGDWVTKGQPLAQLLTGTIEIEVKAAEAELRLREQELREMEQGSLAEEKLQAHAKMIQCKALATFAKEKQRRWEKLFAQGNSASREEMELATQESVAAEQAQLAAQAAYELAMKGPREEKKAQAAARRDFAEEQVNLLKDRMYKYTMRSPFDGYVVAEYTEVGAWINKGDQVAEVIEIAPIEVTVSVPENYITGLQATMAANEAKNQPTQADVRVDSLGGDVVVGQVTRIVPQADLRSRTFPVKVQVANPLLGSSHMLKAGMLGHVTLPVEAARPSTLVPKDALVLTGGNATVFVALADPKTKQATVRPVPVKLGMSQGSQIQVFGDLKAGDRVVTRGNERIRPGQTVEIISAGTERQAAAK
jgi:RND family efflux transporter MFP subunit